ncbi:MAG: hypothetical protein KDA93_22175 [Planctomycetaceae bacterium]|nr:hypothetical protein [Planctomycetaceae bacterium]
MTPAPIPGYLTKKEVTERYGRSHRSLTRDFSTAIRMGDEEVLTHLKLQTEDGTERAGTEVTLEQIQQLSNNGLSPTWYVEGEWAAQRYGTRETPAPASTEPQPEKIQSDDVRSSASHADSGEVLRRLEAQITDLQRDKEQLYQELTIKNEQIKQANERTRESNILMKELQSLLANAQQRALLPVPQDSVERASAPSIDAFADEEDTEPITVKSSPIPSTQSGSSVKAKGSGRKKAKTPQASTTPKSTDSKPKWHEMPTFRKLLSRRQD